MTGWRLGWIVVPKNLLSIFEKLNEFGFQNSSLNDLALRQLMMVKNF